MTFSPSILSEDLPAGNWIILEEFPLVVVLPLNSCTPAVRAEVGFPFNFLMFSLWSCR